MNHPTTKTNLDPILISCLMLLVIIPILVLIVSYSISLPGMNHFWLIFFHLKYYFEINHFFRIKIVLILTLL